MNDRSSGLNIRRDLFQRADALATEHALKNRSRLPASIWRTLNRFGKPTSLLETARTLIANGQADSAFDLLLHAATFKGATERDAIELYKTFCIWLGNAGLIREAEHRVHQLGRTLNSRQAAQGWFVNFWHRRSILDPDNIDTLVALVKSESGGENVKKALSLIYMTEGATERLHALYQPLIKNKPRSQLARNYLSILAANDPKRFHDFMSKHPKALDSYDTTLAMDLRLAETATDIVDDESLIFARRFSQTNAEIWERISDPGLSVAVVGNSPCEMGRGIGAEIDSHDIVIRFNRPHVDAERQADYGSRTDILVANQTLLPNLESSPSMPIILTGKDWEVFTVFKSHAMRLLADGVKLGTVSRDLRTRINQSLKATSSSGIQTLAAVCTLRGGNAKVGIYGFSLVDQIGADPTSANFFRQSRPSANHNWRGEAVLLDALRRGDGFGRALELAGAERYQNQWRTLEGFRPLRYRLDGDHSDYHCGSAAVMRTLRKTIEERGTIVGDGDYDVMIVNGEGTMHHGSKGFHRKMKVLQRSLGDGKAAYLVNTLWQDNPHDYDDVLKRLSGIFVREVMSQLELLQKHGVSSKLFPDLAFQAPVYEARKAIDYQGGIVMTDFFSKEYDAFVRLTRAEAMKYPFVDMLNMTWDDLIASLKTAEILVTGRHHGVFAACRAEIPFVVFGSNSHKIEGIFKSAGVNIPFCENRADLPAKIKWARKNRAEYQKLFNWFKSYKPWQF